jgi:hypothetical protein
MEESKDEVLRRLWRRSVDRDAGSGDPRITGVTIRPSTHPIFDAAASPDRKERRAGPAPWQRKEQDSGGPVRPEVDAPDNKELLKKMRRVDPNQAKRYRQRTGQ